MSASPSNNNGNIPGRLFFQQGARQLASSSGLLAKSGLERLQKLQLDKKYSETRQRVSQGVQELQLDKKYTETRQRVSQSVQELQLDKKYSDSKQRLAEGVSNLHLDQKFTESRDRLKKNVNLSGLSEQLQKLNLQKLNLAKVIDGMEKDQHYADGLERRNRDFADEQKARAMMAEAERACQNAIASHLEAFLLEHPTATYEEWIQDLHPENLQEGKLLEGLGKELDHRLYVEESDHRILWNRNLGDGLRRAVPPRSRMKAKPEDSIIVDLLDGGQQQQQDATSPAAVTSPPSIDASDSEEGMFDVSLMTTTTTTPATPLFPTTPLLQPDAASPDAMERNLFAADPDTLIEPRSTALTVLQDNMNELMGLQEPPDQVAPWATEATTVEATTLLAASSSSTNNKKDGDLINFDDFL